MLSGLWEYFTLFCLSIVVCVIICPNSTGIVSYIRHIWTSWISFFGNSEKCNSSLSWVSDWWIFGHHGYPFLRIDFWGYRLPRKWYFLHSWVSDLTYIWTSWIFRTSWIQAVFFSRHVWNFQLVMSHRFYPNLTSFVSYDVSWFLLLSMAEVPHPQRHSFALFNLSFKQNGTTLRIAYKGWLTRDEIWRLVDFE